MRERSCTRLLTPPLGWIVGLLVIPLCCLAYRGLSTQGIHALANPWTWRLIGTSTLVAALTTLLCLVTGYPVAWCMAQLSPRWRSFALFLIVLPFWANGLVRTYALMALLRPLGLLDTWFAAVFGLWHTCLPFMILPLFLSIEKLQKRLLEAAEDLGASPWQAFVRIGVPLTIPGIAAGCLMVFIPVLGSFATPELLGGARASMAGSQIQLYFTSARDPAAGAALTLVLMVISASLLTFYYRHRNSEGLL